MNIKKQKIKYYLLSLSSVIVFVSGMFGSMSIGLMEATEILSTFTRTCLGLFAFTAITLVPYGFYNLYKLSESLKKDEVAVMNNTIMVSIIYILSGIVNLVPLSLITIARIDEKMEGFISSGSFSFLVDYGQNIQGNKLYIFFIGIVSLIQVISFIYIIYSLYKNLTYLGLKTKTTPRMAVGSFLVPVINLWMPYLILSEINDRVGSKISRWFLILYLITLIISILSGYASQKLDYNTLSTMLIIKFFNSIILLILIGRIFIKLSLAQKRLADPSDI